MIRTLQKAIEELKKDKPSIDYVRGLLEALVDEEPQKLIPVEIPAGKNIAQVVKHSTPEFISKADDVQIIKGK